MPTTITKYDRRLAEKIIRSSCLHIPADDEVDCGDCDGTDECRRDIEKSAQMIADYCQEERRAHEANAASLEGVIARVVRTASAVMKKKEGKE